MFNPFKSFKRCKEPNYRNDTDIEDVDCAHDHLSVDEMESGYILPKPKEIKLPSEDRAYYTVGSLDDGRVQLTVGYPSSISLTMNEAAVRQMIKLLEAAITEKDQFK